MVVSENAWSSLSGEVRPIRTEKVVWNLDLYWLLWLATMIGHLSSKAESEGRPVNAGLSINLVGLGLQYLRRLQRVEQLHYSFWLTIASHLYQYIRCMHNICREQYQARWVYIPCIILANKYCAGRALKSKKWVALTRPSPNWAE